jgi:outer membrane protein TolC
MKPLKTEEADAGSRRDTPRRRHARRRTRIAVIVLLLVSVPSSGARAEREHGTPLGLAQAIDIAMEQSPLLHAARHQVEGATAGIDRARAELLPKVDFVEAFSRSDNPVFAFGSKLNQGRFGENDFAIERLNGPGAVSNFRTALTFSQPIYTGGKATLALERARLDRLASDQGFERRRHEVMFQTARAYYAALLADADLGVVRAAREVAEANRDLARARADAGVVVESDALSAEVRVAGLREQEIVARHRSVLARAALNEVMGRALDEPIVLADALAEPRATTVAFEELEPRALIERPDYQRLGSEARAQERGVAAAHAELRPTLSATASYEVNALDVLANGQDSWFVGVALRWNLFNGLGDRARIAEARARLGEVQALRAAAARRIGLEVREAFLALQAARERIAVARQAVTHAEESLRIVRDRYETGLTTIVTLLSAEAALTETRASVTRALHDANVGAAHLDLTLGTITKDSFR